MKQSTRLRDGDRLRLSDTLIDVALTDPSNTVRLPAWPPVNLENREPGVTIAGYELKRCLGEGTSGAVFEAVASSGETVAVKVLKLSQQGCDEDQRRFFREVAIAAELVHPNVVRVIDHGVAGPTFYLAMEYVAGETLKERLVRQGPFAPTVALHIVRQIASALELARSRGIVHRDVKPENILIREDGVAKLADFGLAKSTVTSGQSGLTHVGDVMGTIAYMSPEQLQSSISADHRSDIYSLGATLYHMLTGRPPFDSRRVDAELFRKILCERPVPLLALRRDVPPVVNTVVMKCLAKNPEDRYQEARDVARITEQLLAPTEMRATVA